MLKKLFLDLNNFKANLGSVERGDSIELNIKLLDGEDYSRSKFRVLGTKADGKYVEQIEGINLEEKDLKVILEDQFVNCEGIVKLELNVVSVETEITTKEFYFFVSNTMNASIIDSADSLPTLEKVSKYVDDAVDNLEALKGASEDITIINSEFKENEIKRKASEMLREKNEKARLQSEDIRITGEEERKTNELERIQAENDRKVSESNRKLAENTRKTNEAARVEAELNRQSLFEENEEIRNSNENLRIASEKERIKFNSEAKTDELNRKEAEKNRVLAEEERKSSEESRVAAEAIRQNTYTDFNDSEAERRNNEANRVRAEAERVNAESGRNELFNTNEEKRNSTFIESERTRERAFNEAQSNRNEAYEESERVREEAFKVSEVARNEAEEGRVAAEAIRQNTYTDFNDSEAERRNNEANRVRAEAERVNAESGRNELFNTNEEKRNSTFIESERTRERAFNEAQSNRNEAYEESERVREEAFKVSEVARNEAEEGRVAVELLRVEAEKLRVTAETGRVEAENLRIAAEEERKVAETKRDEKIKELENKIDNGGNNSKNEEVIQARTATTGEKFNSLDERIDHEVDRLNKKIDITMLQQEDKGSHIIENTVEGVTSDMVVKGRTLINIHPKSIYRFNAPSSEANKYTQDKSENSVIANITEEIASWCYVDCGAVNRNMLKPNTKYTVAGEFKGIESIVLMDGAGQYSITNQATISDNRAVVQTKSLEEINKIPSETRIIIYCYNEKTVGTVSAKNAMILEGDWTNKPIPQYFEGIKSFGQQEDKISILSHGKNLFNNYFEVGTLSGGNAIIDPQIFRTKDFIRVNGGTNYIFSTSNSSNSIVKVYYDENKKWINDDITRKNSFTTPSNCGYVKLRTFLADSQLDWINESYMLEEGTQATSHQPYISNKKDISLQEPLRSVNSICDLISSEGNPKEVRYIKQYTFNGNENMKLSGAQPDSGLYLRVWVTELTDIKEYSSVNVMCNNIPSKYMGNVPNEEGIEVSNGIDIQILKSKLSSPDLEGFRDWLKKNPTTVIYQLATPVITPLYENINLKTFGERTYVSFENSISGTSSFKAPVNTVATISRLNRENRALEEENAKLKADTYKNAEDIIITNEELQITQSAVDHILVSN